MILFDQDWQEYPTAIRDYTTTNTSFLRLARLYHEMGIKNSTFLLALFQQELQGVDPHDPDLSLELKTKIRIECQWNPWYFFREVLRVPQDGGDSVPYVARRGNIAMTWAFLNHIDYANIQPRQTGKSVGGDCIYVYALTTRKKMEINLITKEDKLRSKNVTRIRSIIEALPPWFAPRTKEDSNNQEEVTVAAMGSKLHTHLPRPDPKAARKVCRGDTAPILALDEGPFCSNIQISLPGALASGTAAREQAAARGGLYGNLYTTTAGSLDDKEGRYMYDLISGGAPWDEVFLDARDQAHLEELISQNCTGMKVLINGTFSHLQLGLSNEWMRKAIANVSPITAEEADKDFFNVWRSGKASNPLHVDILKRVAASEMDPVYREITTYGNIIRWYIDELEIKRQVNDDRKWILGLDTSNAIGRDAIAGVFIDAISGKVVGAFTCNQDNLVTFATGFLASVMAKYPNTVLIPENKSTGQFMIDALLISLVEKGQDPFKRIFNYYVQEHDDKFKDEFRDIVKTQYRDESWYSSRKKQFGFMTDGARRNTLYSTVLQTAARTTCTGIRDRVLAKEIKELSEKNGRIDHSSGAHDDHVIAWLLAQWMRTHGKNLAYYGIHSVDLSEEETEVTPETLFEKGYQKGVRLQMERFADLLKEEMDPYRIKLLESKIKELGSYISSTGGAIGSIDELITRIASERETLYAARRGNAMQRIDGNRLFGSRR